MKENKPEISIICSANRPQYWMNFYENLGNNNISFEVIFVGPNEPDFKLPDNFRFIKSLVKPAQCWEIAARNSTGDIIMNMSDDEELKGAKNPLDKLFDEYKSYNDDKIILSCRFMINGALIPQEGHRYNVKDSESLIMPIAGLISRKLYIYIGGIDRNFLGIYWDLDIAMRIYALGGRVILSKYICVNEEEYKANKIKLFHACGSDRGLLDYLWANGKSFNRARPVEPFSDERILEESQGPKGTWL